MDVNSSKRVVTASRASRQGSSISSRDADSAHDQNVQLCNRIGCNGRIKYGNQYIATRSSQKAKISPNGVIETSSKSDSATTREKSSHLSLKRKSSPQSGLNKSESSQSGDSESARSTSSPIRSPANESKQVPALKSGITPSSVRSRNKIQYTSRSTVNTSLKNIKGSSTSEAVTPSCSSSKNTMNKRSPEGDNSSLPSRCRQTTAPASFVRQISSSSGGSDSASDSANKSRARLSYRQNIRNTPCFRESEPPRSVGRPRLPLRYSANASSSGSSLYSASSSNDYSESTLMPYTSSEHGYSHLMNRGMLQRYGMDGTAEVLLALERIEQDEEMTHAQILALETSLFLSGLNLYDRHRDMRLDIDSMSYEELLALGDRMGTVSTALSEEELLKCVKRSIYQMGPPELGFTRSGEDGDDVKCSICQEDYIKGDEIGELVECQHAYHVGCVNQWLRMKNWCPICKQPASSS